MSTIPIVPQTALPQYNLATGPTHEVAELALELFCNAYCTTLEEAVAVALGHYSDLLNYAREWDIYVDDCRNH